MRAFGAVGGTPVVFESGEGAYLLDVDGHRYVDLVMSWGALILGHAHPAIVEAAVLGVPHESHGEEVKAVVVSNDPALTAETLIAWCKERMAAYKYPRIVEFSESLPKGPTGKILKRELR